MSVNRTQLLMTYMRKRPLAHGYVVVESGGAFAPLITELTSFFTSTLPGSDVVVYEDALFGINEARELRRKAHLTAPNSKFFLVASPRLSIEAQNALLKVCEDPPSQTHIFIFVVSPDALLPTLRSRLVSVTLPVAYDLHPERETELMKFLRDTPETRLRMVTKYATDRTWTAALLRDLEVLIVGWGLVGKDPEWTSALETINNMRTALYRPAAASRMIAEYVTLMLPLLAEQDIPGQKDKTQ
ncbi:MAG: hypothetical protein HYU35_02390 [Parcubacteria group bacterium]|nr:hypothetical protein [Parcubacteria group bacterium]